MYVRIESIVVFAIVRCLQNFFLKALCLSAGLHAAGARKAGEGCEPEEQGIISFQMHPEGQAPLIPLNPSALLQTSPGPIVKAAAFMTAWHLSLATVKGRMTMITYCVAESCCIYCC